MTEKLVTMTDVIEIESLSDGNGALDSLPGSADEDHSMKVQSEQKIEIDLQQEETSDDLTQKTELENPKDLDVFDENQSKDCGFQLPPDKANASQKLPGKASNQSDFTASGSEEPKFNQGDAVLKSEKGSDSDFVSDAESLTEEVAAFSPNELANEVQEVNGGRRNELKTNLEVSPVKSNEANSDHSDESSSDEDLLEDEDPLEDEDSRFDKFVATLKNQSHDEDTNFNIQEELLNHLNSSEMKRKLKEISDIIKEIKSRHPDASSVLEELLDQDSFDVQQTQREKDIPVKSGNQAFESIYLDRETTLPSCNEAKRPTTKYEFVRDPAVAAQDIDASDALLHEQFRLALEEANKEGMSGQLQGAKEFKFPFNTKVEQCRMEKLKLRRYHQEVIGERVLNAMSLNQFAPLSNENDVKCTEKNAGELHRRTKVQYRKENVDFKELDLLTYLDNHGIDDFLEKHVKITDGTKQYNYKELCNENMEMCSDTSLTQCKAKSYLGQPLFWVSEGFFNASRLFLSVIFVVFLLLAMGVAELVGVDFPLRKSLGIKKCPSNSRISVRNLKKKDDKF